jgi:hypothetical protein
MDALFFRRTTRRSAFARATTNPAVAAVRQDRALDFAPFKATRYAGADRRWMKSGRQWKFTSGISNMKHERSGPPHLADNGSCSVLRWYI